jgi:hypothetical protein
MGKPRPFAGERSRPAAPSRLAARLGRNRRPTYSAPTLHIGLFPEGHLTPNIARKRQVMHAWRVERGGASDQHIAGIDPAIAERAVMRCRFRLVCAIHHFPNRMPSVAIVFR